MQECWEIRLTVAEHAEVFAEFVAAACGSDAMSFHRDGEGQGWLVSIIAEAEPAAARLSRAVDEATLLTGISPSSRSVCALPDKDWLEENRRSFPPLDIACFHIRGSHVESPPPEDRLVLRLDAGQAFGSGTHATTHGCLVMLEKHLEGIEVQEGGRLRVADIGSGSGILAMAASKLRPDAHVIAVDSDPVAVRVAEENAAANGLADGIVCGVSDGYGAELVRESAPFDLILANILPTPLVDMASDAASCLATHGALIVSGLNEGHADNIAAAHASAGLAICDRFCLDGWVTLVFRHAERGG